MGTCLWCREGDVRGKVTRFDWKLKMWVRVTCTHCKGTGREIPVPTHTEAVAAREAKAS